MQSVLPIGKNIWTIPAPLTMSGVAFGTKTTVVRLSDGELWLHAPGPLEADALAEVAKLGSVAWLVAPNMFHHLYLAEAQSAFPDAPTIVATGLPDKVKGLQFQELLGASHKKIWQEDLDAVFVGGMPMLNETVFLHKPSKTLIITDLIFNFSRGESLWTRFFLRMMGAHDRLGPSRFSKFMMKDKDLVKQAVDQVLEWDFKRIVMCHGKIVETQAKRSFYEAFAFLG